MAKLSEDLAPLSLLLGRIFGWVEVNFPFYIFMDQKNGSRCDLRATFATAFYNWRKKMKTPLKRIAHDLGVSIATVNSWESGERFPTGQHFEILADYTCLPPCHLLCVVAGKCVHAECLLAVPKKK